ncbi:MAG: AAA family ATPase, partial [Balneolaceae bacterium]|nr:AAA family ATPase [Balneolaceae bacterium]
MSQPTTDSKLLNFLADPDSYAFGPHSVKHLQTHISHVFIAPPFVYKIKKPLNLEFLDFSTLQKRKYYCKRELELNRRLCDQIYLGLTSIVERDGSFDLVDGDHDEAVEYAVKMKKLDERLLLSEIIRHSTLSFDQLDRVADCLTPFYRNQNPSEEILKMGDPEKVRYNTEENFRQTRPFVGKLIDNVDYEAIQYYTGQHFERFGELFEKRKEKKKIIDGHGDLRLEHVHLTEERVCIYDCVEFNDRFRYQDVANDLAFLAMELDAEGLVRHSHHFIHKMQEKLEDPGLLRLIDFYKCYRAYVRAKVKSIESEEEELDKKQQEEAARSAQKFYSLALRYALIGSGPVVLIFMGRVASGKSTLAEVLADKLGLKRFNSDRIRKALFGLDLYERTPDDMRDQIYSREVNARTYSTLYQKMEEELSRGQSVI